MPDSARGMMSSVVYALVDYDNQRPPSFGGRSRPGRSPNLRDHEDYLAKLVQGLLRFRGQLEEEFVELRIRLYGGWSGMPSGERTETGDMVATALRRVGTSSRLRATRIRVELAECLLLAPEQPIHGTFRSMRWRGEALRVSDHPLHCAEAPSRCAAIEGLYRWARGRCPRNPECRVLSEDAVISQGQKLVDSMLVADTIAATHVSKHVVAVSMDDDMIPGLLSARQLGAIVTVLRFGRRDPSTYDAILARYGVAVVDYPAFGG